MTTPLPPEDPAVAAWNEFKLTNHFESAQKWARIRDHIEDSLWSAFKFGWIAAHNAIDGETKPEDLSKS